MKVQSSFERFGPHDGTAGGWEEMIQAVGEGFVTVIRQIQRESAAEVGLERAHSRIFEAIGHLIVAGEHDRLQVLRIKSG